MWLEKLLNIKERQFKGDLSHLNLRFELHSSIYIIEVLKGKINFSLDDKELIIKKEKEIFNLDQFYYWWQIQRYNEIYDEEKKLIQSFEEIQKKIIKLQKTAPIIKEKDPDIDKKQKKIDEINLKISKLSTYLKNESPKFKNKLQLLSNFRNTYPSKDSLSHLIQNIQLYLQYQ